MVEIADIKDRESLQAWLETQPRNTSVNIAHRAAMRVLPVYLHWVLTSAEAQVYTMMHLAALRDNLFSQLVGHRLDFQLRLKINYPFYNTAALRYETGGIKKHTDEFNAAFAIMCASESTIYHDDDTVYLEASAAVSYSVSAKGNDNWSLIEIDCLELNEWGVLDGNRLWQEFDNPFAKEWQGVKSILQNDSVDWSFWIKWYEASLNGEPLNYEMLEKIALIDPKDWEQGPEHVNAMIAGIEAEFDTQEDRKTTKDILERNTNVIEAQLDALVLLVTEEIHRIRGPNNITSAESDQIAVRVSLLNSIIASVEKIKESLVSSQSYSNALVVVDEQLSEIAVVAEKLAEDGAMQEISAPIMAMGVTIKYLTDCGTPGHVASGVAAFEYGAKWLKAKWSK